MDFYLEFVDDIRHINLDELNCGPAVEDMVSFLSSCPELALREFTRHVFRLCSVCLGHVLPTLPIDELGYSRVGTIKLSGFDMLGGVGGIL